MKILISGVSGLIGSELAPHLKKQGHAIYQLVRSRSEHAKDAKDAKDEIVWNPDQGVINPVLLEGMDVVIHLAGESIMGRWTSSKKVKIRESRVQSTSLLAQTLTQLHQPPSVFVCASAIGYYGNRGQEVLTEQSSKGEGFLADVCQAWEQASQIAAAKSIRTVNLRFGMVLSERGGALKQMLTIFKWGLGGCLGTGEQFTSWIDIRDVVQIIDFAMHNPVINGPLNVVSPYPVTNRKFTEMLGQVLQRPTFLPVPLWMIKLIFGQLGEEVLLSSHKVLPQKLEEQGYVFAYPQLEKALSSILKNK